MYQRELVGIPYVGNNYNINTEEFIENSNLTLKEAIEEFSTRQYIVIIDAEKRYYSYLRDICFDYMNGEIFIPYLTYDLYELKSYKGNKDRHLLVIDDKVNIRYNYDIEKYIIYNKEIKQDILLYDVKEKRCIKIIWDKLTKEDTFSMKDIYEKYLNCIAFIEDNKVVKNIGGYNYLTKEADGFTNTENRLRKSKKIKTFRMGKINFDNKQKSIFNYRDVRNITAAQLILMLRNNSNLIRLTSELDIGQKVKYIIHDELNFIDRLRTFELNMFNIVHNKLVPIEAEYSDIWDKISNDYYAIYAVGDLEYKLTFKGYWINKEKPDERLKTIYYRVYRYGKHK